MTIDTSANHPPLEPMPDALLAALFSGGVVILPDEFKQTSGPAAFMAAPLPSHAENLPTATEATGPATEATQAETPAQGTVSWLGRFEKKVLVVVHHRDVLHIHDTDYELLTKILGAVKLSIADIALVNAAQTPLDYETLQEMLPAQVALYFGIEPVDIGAPIRFPHFQIQAWNQTRFLCAPALVDFNASTPEAIQLKKNLWEALKKIFEPAS